MKFKLLLGCLTLCVSVGGSLIWQESQAQPISQVQPAPVPSPAKQKADVPYVPTPNEVVEQMLNMAAVTKDDVLYDLGSGDGRVAIAAAKKGARSLGVEIDPLLVAKSNENAKLAGVSDRVKFVEQDLFKTNLSDASVVTLYLLTSINLKLRPKLLNELKPGTRLVSHQFHMGLWKPERVVEMTVNSRQHKLYYWVIPSQVSGTWQFNMPAGRNQEKYTLQLNQDFQEVSGTLINKERSMQLSDAKLTGDRLSFKVTQPLKETVVTMQFNGRVTKDAIAGSVEILGGKEAGRQDWVAGRR
jgi:precorrin-6B methylase 2